MRSLLLLTISLGLVAPTTGYGAPIIQGGSNLLTAADAVQIETWLGQGPIALTNIFSRAPGDGKTSYNFHAAADGQGATFVIIEILPTSVTESIVGVGAVNANIPGQIIGGYNPQSWSSINAYNITATDDLRTAFIFNLTTDIKQNQNLIGQGNPVSSTVQTWNYANRGPTWGHAGDISIPESLNYLYTYNSSYGGTYQSQSIIDSPSAGINFSTGGLLIGRMEVFTISPAAAADEVPEPASVVLWSLGGIAAFTAWRKRRRLSAP